MSLGCFRYPGMPMTLTLADILELCGLHKSSQADDLPQQKVQVGSLCRVGWFQSPLCLLGFQAAEVVWDDLLLIALHASDILGGLQTMGFSE